MIDLLLNNLDLILDADGDGKRVRDAILQLAVRGRLVAQEAGDEDALLAVQRDQTVWASTATAKSVRQLGGRVESEEGWFEVPTGWAWARIPWIAEDPGQEKPSEPFNYVDISAVDGAFGRINWEDVEEVSAHDAPSRARKRLSPGCVIYSSVRPYQRKIAVFEASIDQKFIASTGFQVLLPRASITTGFLWGWLRSDDFDRFAAVHAKGAAYPAINDRDFSKALVPVPPLAEQHRIVAKVDELMALCDTLETSLKRAKTTREQFASSVSHALTGPTAASA